ncbi:MAG: glycosyltransferase family 4 protein [Vicinamibacterales bacterium]
MSTWHVITCEYPPEIGGVSEHTHALAARLRDAGERVTVWAPGQHRRTPPDDARVKEIGFGLWQLLRANRALDQEPSPRRLFVQWVPQGFGWRGMNVAIALWLWYRARVRHDELHMMIHEAFRPFRWRPWIAAPALVQRLMIAIVSASAFRIWLSTPSWASYVAPYHPRRTACRWLPVATLLGRGPDVARPSVLSGPRVVGHFGTYSPLVMPLLEPAMLQVLNRTDARIRLMGRGSAEFRDAFVRREPDHADRVEATGAIEALDVPAALGQCDLLLLPYPDGITARRTSTLKALAVGTPVVTNAGALTEPFWRDHAVLLVSEPDGQRVGLAAVDLLADAPRRRALGAAGQRLFARLFHPDVAVRLLRGDVEPQEVVS